MSFKELQVPTGSILETSYGLVEADKISPKWRNMQCTLFIISAISGLAFYCLFSAVRKELSGACIINVNLVFQESNPDVINEIASNWGSPAVCDFCLYTPLTCSVLALVLLVYFIMSGRGGRGTAGFLAQPWRIVMPTILFSAFSFSVVFATTYLTYFGRMDFCDQIDDRNLTFPPNMTAEDKKGAMMHYKLIRLAGCKSSGNLSGLNITDDPETEEYFDMLSLVQIAGLIDATSWCFGFLLVLSRFLLMPDFRLLRFDFILESGGKTNVSRKDSTQDSVKWADADPAVSVRSYDSALSSAQTALTSLDQQSLKHRYSNPFGGQNSIRDESFPSRSRHSKGKPPNYVEAHRFEVLASSLSVPLSPTFYPIMWPTHPYPTFSVKNEMCDQFSSSLRISDQKLRLCW